MRALAIVAAFLAAGLAAADQIAVQHLRPSKVLRYITGEAFGQKGLQGLIPAGITSFKADDAAGTLVVEGPAEAISELRKIVDEFDVAPRKVSVRITIKSPADKYESTTTTEINNNSSLTLRDGTAGIEISLAARINGDGTVTGTLNTGATTRSENLVTRFQNKVPTEFRVQSGNNSTRQPAKSKEELKATEIVITVTFSIKDFPNEGPIDPTATESISSLKGTCPIG